MKKIIFLCAFSAMSLFCPIEVNAQIAVRVESGMIYINDGSFKPNPQKYTALADSLDKKIKINDNDTTSLFFRSLLFLSFNGLNAKPFPGEKGALENLIAAKQLAEKAISLKMQNFNLKVLRAQIYKELTYRFTSDQAWQYNSKQVADRRKQFNTYKELANKYYSELAEVDKANANDYEKLKVKYNYPL